MPKRVCRPWPVLALLCSLVLLIAGWPGRAAALGLSQPEAELRARQLTHVAYQIELKLDPSREDFDGRTVLRFALKPGASGQGLFAELDGARIHHMQINGVDQSAAQIAARYDGHRIRFAPAELKPGSNQVEVAYRRAYVKSGNGLHRFKDVTDGRLYHYNHFEAYYANLVFPCFDQPDIKARIELQVEAPADWEVVASTPAAPPLAAGERRRWSFPPTPEISTYVLTLAAGPFKIWSDRAGKVPLRLLARQSVAQYVESSELLTLAAQALAFFAAEFSYDYPYEKLDLILVPGFPAGAMENLAGITLGEDGTVFRSKQPPAAYVGRAATLAHEIAHMWFGDLVTMKWWNGLWLNESFAALMESLAVAEATRYRDEAWPLFYSTLKRSAYREDQLVSTHPIELAVADTDQARANFDSITYGKGASVLKQLRFFLGADRFRAGLKVYFREHAYGNTTLPDFIDTLGRAAQVDLGSWQQQWLQTAGLNTVQARWQCQKGRISAFVLQQSAPADFPTLRSHRTEIGFYALAAGNAAVQLQSVLAAAYAGAETPVPQAVGKPCPALVFPNQNDYDYVKVSLDPVSLATVQKSLGRVDDRLGRQMLWGTLYDMLRDARIAPLSYLDIALQHLPQERDPQILSDVLRGLSQQLLRYIAPARRTAARERLEAYLLTQLRAAAAGSDLQLLYYRSYLRTAITPAAEGFLQRLLRGEEALPGLPINQDRRWGIVQALSRLGAKNAGELISAEQKTDATDEGRKGAFIAEALLPQAATKRRWFGRITRSAEVADDNKLDAGDLRAAMSQFSDPSQEALLAQFTDRYFAELLHLSERGEDDMYMQRLTYQLYPIQCEPKVIDQTIAFLHAHPALPAGVIKSLRIQQQEAELCRRLQAL
jgi:aminopeptidase N